MGATHHSSVDTDPVNLVAGESKTTAPTLGDGDISQVLLDTRGNLKVALFAPNTPTGMVMQTSADGRSASTQKIDVTAYLSAYNGGSMDMVRTPNVFKTIAAVAVTAATPLTIWTPTAGKKFRLMGFALSLSVAGSVILLDSAAEILRTPLMAAGVGQPSAAFGNGILSALANNTLKIDVTASGSVSGYVFGTEE